MTSVRVLLVFNLGLMSACGSQDGADVAAACIAKGELSPKICECVGQEADKGELSEETLALIVADFAGDNKAREHAQQQLDISDGMEAGMFILTATLSCSFDSD